MTIKAHDNGRSIYQSSSSVGLHKDVCSASSPRAPLNWGLIKLYCNTCNVFKAQLTLSSLFDVHLFLCLMLNVALYSTGTPIQDVHHKTMMRMLRLMNCIICRYHTFTLKSGILQTQFYHPPSQPVAVAGQQRVLLCWQDQACAHIRRKETKRARVGGEGGGGCEGSKLPIEDSISHTAERQYEVAADDRKITEHKINMTS